MKEESIAIIGAGIAGLSAGCYGQMNGYRTHIFELHDKPGGLCTSWTRRGYTFDGCIHWLVGSGEGSPFNQIWRELGAVQGRTIVDHDVFTRVEGEGGKAFIVYTDLDRLEEHMKALSPEDADTIDEFISAAHKFTRLSDAMGDPGGPSSWWDKIKAGFRMLPLLGTLRKFSKMSVQEFGARLRDPFLHDAFVSLFDFPDFPMTGVLATLAWMHNEDAGYPVGGSLAFARAIEQRYLDLGGEIHYRARVERILVKDDRAVGVRLTDGTEHPADVVISAADGHSTIFEMLEGEYTDEKIRGYYDEWPIFPPLVQVSLGVARDLSDEPHMVSYPLDDPIEVDGRPRARLGVKHYGYDPTLAPEGKSVLIVMFDSDYEYWRALVEEGEERYDAEKKQIALDVIDRLDGRFPGLEEAVEVVDVATPLTTERYTGNWKGSMEGWLITTDNIGMTFGRGMRQMLPGLDNFYMAGQWVEPGGGVPTAALSARKAIKTICKRDGRRFTTETP